jgi:hypothetical protein
MKNRFFLMVLLMSLLQSTAHAQQDFIREPNLNKPLLFTDLPAIIPVSLADLERAMVLQTGATWTVSTISFSGIVRAVTKPYDNSTQSVSIKLTNREGAYMVLTAIRDADGKISYTGRVTSFLHGDCLVLRRLDDGQYAFEKKNYYEVFGE